MRSLTARVSKLAKSVPLRRVLVVPFILQISLAVALTGWLSIRNGQQAVNEVAVQLRSEITARIQQYLQTYVETPHKINQLNANAVRLGEVNVQDLSALEQHLWYQVETFDTVTAVYVGSEYREHVAVERAEDGRFRVKVSGEATQHDIRIYAAEQPGQRTKLLRSRRNYDPRTRPWYQSAVKTGTANWGGIYRLFATPKYVLNASLPIYNDHGQLLGVAAVDFSLTGISQFLRSLRIGRSGKTFILERRTGLLVGSSATQQPYVIQNPTAPLNQQNPVRVKAIESSDVLTRRTAKYLQQRFGNLSEITQTQQLDFDQTQQLDFDLAGERQFLQVVPLKTVQGLDWLIIVVMPERDFMDQINANTRNTIVLCFAAFGLATALGILTARWIAQPILRLGGAAKAIAAGNLDQTVSVSSTSELNGLAQSFNQMAQQLRESFSALARTNEELESRVAQRTTELGENNSQLQQEIRDRQAAEAALKTSEAELRLMFAAMTDTVIVFDAEGRFLKYVQTQSLSYEPDVDPIGKTVYEVLPKIVADAITNAIRQALHLRQPGSDGKGKNIFVEYYLAIKNRETWFLASVSPLSDHAVLWVARDISKLKKTEAALKQAKESADAANLAKSQFLSNMSHELRTPLNAILGFSQLMSRNPSVNPGELEHLEIISRSGEHLLTLINDVLSMSKIEVGRTTLDENSFDLYCLLDSLEEMLQLKAESRGLQLSFERSPAVPQYVQTDESKLRQVLINILSNAIKFTQAGSVTLRVSLIISHLPLVGEEEQRTNDIGHRRSSGFPQGRTIQFEVEDTGPGIAPSELESLFKPFVQTQTGRKSQQGTGLVLTISRQFVRLMGGDITVSSTPGQGTIFTFGIQIASAKMAEIQPRQPDRRVIGLELDQPKYRILVVEDKWENRQLLVKLLAPLGFEVREAENGQEGVALWETWEPHLIWMDMRMPVMDGYEATKQIKAHLKGQATVIVALTASAFDEEQAVILSAGCDDFVRKPFRVETIFEKMAKYLGVRYVYAQEASQNDELGEKSDLQQTLREDLRATSLAEALTQMPPLWVAQLHQAALCTDEKLIFSLIEQIPESNAPLANTLASLVNNFRIDQVIDCTQPGPK